MSSGQDLIRRSVAALNAGDVDGYFAGFAPDSVRWATGLNTPLPLSDIEANLRQMVAAFDQLHLQEDLLFGGSGHVFARWTLRGIQPVITGESRRPIGPSPSRQPSCTPSAGRLLPSLGFMAI